MKSIKTLSRNFVIPPGTQVVLQVAKSVGDHFRKPGSVGVVIKAPPNNDENYLVRFTDGTTVEANFDELTLRRTEIDVMLAKEDFEVEPFVIYRCRVGSRAFGLANEDSDDDLRGIFLPTAEMHWSLYKLPEQVETNDGQTDEVYWELEKFVRLALKANPNILETLWTPDVLHATQISDRLREIRCAFLSKHVYKTYSGYVLSQFRRMKNKFDSSGEYKVKHAMHLIRLMYSGIAAVRTGEIMVDVTDHRDELLTIRAGEWTFEQVRDRSLALDKEFQIAFESTPLPEQPNLEVVNQFLIDARRSMVN